MARPVGRFAKQKEECYVWVKTLTKAKSKCWASNRYLAGRLGCSERQVSRYLKALEEEGRITRQQYRYSRSGSLKTKRHVYLKSKWMPALVVPAGRFESYQRKVRMSGNSLSKEELEAKWRKEYGIPEDKPLATLEERRKQDLRQLTTPKRAGVVYSAGIQMILDKLPKE